MRPVRRGNCSKTPRLEGLKKLAGVSLLSHSTLTELQSRLAKVQTCFTLVKDNPDLLWGKPTAPAHPRSRHQKFSSSNRYDHARKSRSDGWSIESHHRGQGIKHVPFHGRSCARREQSARYRVDERQGGVPAYRLIHAGSVVDAVLI